MIHWIPLANIKAQIQPQHWRFTLISFVVSILPLMFYLPPQYAVLFSTSIVLRALTLKPSRHKIALWALLLFVPLTLFLVYTGLRQQNFTYSFLTLLAAMGCAKLLETRNYRDLRVLFLLSLLLILAFLMYSQSILIFIYAIFALSLNVWTLLNIEHRQSQIISFGRWRDILKLLGMSLPFTVLMFFLFPRIDPLWRMPNQQAKNVTGLPEEMGMGDISSLAQSNEIAFRVKFANGDIPASDKLYWRGPVLWFFDGQNWQQWAQDFYQSPSPFQYQSSSEISYEVMPVNEDLHWLLALDLPTSFPSGSKMGRSYQIRLPVSQTKSKRYELTSALDYRITSLTPKERAAALYLSNDIPKTKALAESIWQANGQTTAGFVQGFMQYLREEEFYYSLEPPPGAGDVETFLFANGRIGFCEHYANAFAQAARSVGIPSRVVLGYQGGELNPLNGDWLVREEAAHAWVEIWYDDLGWQRVDPTAAVAPERILQARLNRDSLTYGDDNRAFGSRFAEQLSAFAWARNALAYGQAFWQDWVIDLDKDRQNSLFSFSGLGQLGKTLVIFVIILVVWVLSSLLFFYWQRRKINELTPLQRELQKLLARLRKKGYEKMATESITVFLKRIAGEFSAQNKRRLIEIAIRYERVRYLENENENQLIKVIKRTRL